MLIVLEGLDGAGKSTQIERLRAYIEGRGLKTEYLHFPRFDAPVYGDLIARFLRGELGSVDTVDPYVVALLFAGDRADAAATIRRWMDRGSVVILDRYVYSNIAYQCSKLVEVKAANTLKKWILDTEYGYFAIPRPDLSLFLDVPIGFVERKLREQRDGDDREYLHGAQDIHEASMELQRRVRQTYLDAAREDATLHVVDCADAEGNMASPDEIFARIAACVAPLLENRPNR